MLDPSIIDSLQESCDNLRSLLIRINETVRDHPEYRTDRGILNYVSSLEEVAVPFLNTWNRTLMSKGVPERVVEVITQDLAPAAHDLVEWYDGVWQDLTETMSDTEDQDATSAILMLSNISEHDNSESPFNRYRTAANTITSIAQRERARNDDTLSEVSAETLQAVDVLRERYETLQSEVMAYSVNVDLDEVNEAVILHFLGSLPRILLSLEAAYGTRETPGFVDTLLAEAWATDLLQAYSEFADKMEAAWHLMCAAMEMEESIYPVWVSCQQELMSDDGPQGYIGRIAETIHNLRAARGAGLPIDRVDLSTGDIYVFGDIKLTVI